MHRSLLSVGVSLTLAFAAVACGGEGAADRTARSTAGGEVVPNPSVTPAPPVVTPPVTPALTRVADITGNPASFVGKTVTVEADVDEVLSPFAFVLDEDSPLAGGIDNDLVVAYPRSLSLADLDNKWLKNKVRVTGTVGTYTITELRKELNRDLTGKIEARVKGKPVLIATSVERLNR
jgi:hypothetical protein